MIALKLKDISLSYDGKRNILEGVSLEVEEGALAAITGSSGSGKSTLALIACGVIPKSLPGVFSGSVEVFGEDIKDKNIFDTAQQISMVFQDPESQLFAPDAADEVAFAPENLCRRPEEIESIVQKALETVGMGGFEDYPPSLLSGGQQQLIALASILSLDPRIIIFDEATAQIDEAGVRLIREAVKKLRESGKTIIVIEHGNALRDMCDIVYKLESGRLKRV